jgi:Flp pilus assembly protein TadG
MKTSDAMRIMVHGLKQAGATAVEFVFILPLLVGMFYAIFVYGYVFVLHQALNYASEEAARAVVAIASGGPGAAALQQSAANLAVDQALSFLPANQRALVGSPGVAPPAIPGGLYIVQVTLTMPIGGLFPVIPLPLIGNVPILPANLQAISVD